MLTLSPRENQIACGFLDSEAERSIAERLSIAEATVHSYIRRFYMKLGTHDRTSTIVRIFEAAAEVSSHTREMASRNHEVEQPSDAF